MCEVRAKQKSSGTRHWLRATFLAIALYGAVIQADEVTVHVRADQPGAAISRYLYGQFAEHLGRGIYDGIWVGPESEISNTRGFRNDVLSALQELRIPVIRWPGGCFADEYNWRDGIGPRDDRPMRINTHWGWADETNAFGTHEFMDLTELLGSEAYIAGNVGSATPREMAQWLEYMTADNDSELARLRRANGREEPWVVNFFGVGNETWGCGGNMTPEYYTNLFNRYATFLKPPPGRPVKKIASGGSNEQTDWTAALVAGNVDGFGNRRQLDGISHHYYTLPTGTWSRKGAATGFPEEEWISTLDNAMRIDGYLALNEAVLDEYDPEGHVGLYLDEWGTWYDADPNFDGGVLYQQNSIRDALVAALSFNIFHRHAHRLHMANIAQTVNVLQAVILTRGDEMILTPTYHAFAMYRSFQDSTFLPVTLDGAQPYSFGDRSVPQVSATSARTSDGRLVIALVNLHARDAVDAAIDVTGFRWSGATAQVLTGDSIDAHNTFESPSVVVPADLALDFDDHHLRAQLPARSISVVTMQPDSTVLYTLRNSSGMEARIAPYGATIQKLTAADRDGRFEDIVLGFETVHEYIQGSPYFGSVVGRYGNRIANARFELDGKEYTLASNDGPNSLHGGIKGFDKVVWTVDRVDSQSIALSYVSADGEEGFPGEVSVSVVYTLTDDNELRIAYRGETDKATPLNLTNHSYFNLAGQDSGDILGHVVQINADAFTPVDETLIPLGEIRPVDGTPFDFRDATAIGDRVDDDDEQLDFGGGYDHNWVLNRESEDLSLAARVSDPDSGRIMEVLTTEPGLQFYVGNFLDGSIVGKGGAVYGHRTGFCMETQHYPDSPNQPDFPSTILRPGDVYESTTVYRFSAQ